MVGEMIGALGEKNRKSARPPHQRHQHGGGLGRNAWRNDARLRVEVIVAAPRHIGRRRMEPRHGTGAELRLIETETHCGSPISSAFCIGKNNPDDHTPNQPSTTVPQATRS